MFQIRFRPKPEWQEKVAELELSKKLRALFLICVSKAFDGTIIKSGESSSPADESCVILITISGITPTNDEAAQAMVQIIASQLAIHKLDRIYSITAVKITSDEQDKLLDPRLIPQAHYPRTMLDAFKLESLAIPNRFICPITQEIMSQPTYLESNPKIYYERMALLKWVSEKNTDPTTRKKINTAGMIDATGIRDEIYSFVFDLISGNDVAHYFRAEDGDELEATATTTTSVSTATMGPALFAASENSDNADMGLASVFSTLRLSDEFLKLGAKALRRAANFGKLEEIKQLTSQFGPEIIDIQDNNPEKKFTALHLAIKEQKHPVVKYLLENGAQTDIPDAQGQTAADLMPASDFLGMPAL